MLVVFVGTALAYASLPPEDAPTADAPAATSSRRELRAKRHHKGSLRPWAPWQQLSREEKMRCVQQHRGADEERQPAQHQKKRQPAGARAQAGKMEREKFISNLIGAVKDAGKRLVEHFSSTSKADLTKDLCSTRWREGEVVPWQSEGGKACADFAGNTSAECAAAVDRATGFSATAACAECGECRALNDTSWREPGALRGTVTRYALRSLSAAEQERFAQAVELMMEGGPGHSDFYKIAGHHGFPWYNCVHGDPTFVHWHRIYVAEFEKLLRKADMRNGYDGRIGLPYWDWQADPINSNNADAVPDGRMEAMPQVIRDYFGRASGTEAVRAMIKESSIRPRDVLARDLMTFGFSRFNLDDAIIDRLSDSDVWETAQLVVLDDCNRPTGAGVTPGCAHNQAVRHIERAHGSVHMASGFPMTRVPVASYHPIFWAHHCNVDRLWQAYISKQGSLGKTPTDLYAEFNASALVQSGRIDLKMKPFRKDKWLAEEEVVPIPSVRDAPPRDSQRSKTWTVFANTKDEEYYTAEDMYATAHLEYEYHELQDAQYHATATKPPQLERACLERDGSGSCAADLERRERPEGSYCAVSLNSTGIDMTQPSFAALVFLFPNASSLPSPWPPAELTSQTTGGAAGDLAAPQGSCARKMRKAAAQGRTGSCARPTTRDLARRHPNFAGAISFFGSLETDGPAHVHPLDVELEVIVTAKAHELAAFEADATLPTAMVLFDVGDDGGALTERLGDQHDALRPKATVTVCKSAKACEVGAGVVE